MNRHRARAAVFGMLSIVWVCAMTWFSMQSGEESGALSGKIVDGLLGWMLARGADAEKIEFFVRKLAHFGMFALSGLLTGMSLFSIGRGRGALMASLGLEAVIAVSNELVQLLPEGRACSVRDMLIDFSGAALGVGIAMLISRFGGQKERQGKEL